jgi:hypothetical protein
MSDIWVNLGDLQGISSHADRIFVAIGSAKSYKSMQNNPLTSQDVDSETLAVL